MAGVNNMRIHGHIFSSVSSKPVMSDYSGQIMAQQYTVDVSHSPVGLQRIHSSPQQPRQTHMIQSGQMHPQQQMMMQASQPIHMPPCTSMQVQMASMGPPQMISQQGVAIMNQQGQIQQAGAAQGTMMQAQHQMIATGQISPQQMPTQILVTSMGQQQMLSTMVTQVQQQQPAPHQMGPPTATHLGPQHQPQQSLQQQQQPQQQQQTQQHQMMASTQMLQQQSQGQHSLNTQQSIVHSPGFPHPSQPHMHNPNPNYQQTSPHRATMARYPTPSPENMQHGTPPIYRSPVQRSINTPRVIGQSSAIRQALGHLPPTPTPVPVHSSVEPHPPPPASMKLLEKDAMEALIKTVDPLEAVEDDVSNALLHLVEEFVDDVIEQTARVAKHRSAQKVETKDVQYVLERRYKIFLPPGSVGSVQPADRNPYIKSPATEAHRQRMSLIKKGIQKP